MAATLLWLDIVCLGFCAWCDWELGQLRHCHLYQCCQRWPHLKHHLVAKRGVDVLEGFGIGSQNPGTRTGAEVARLLPDSEFVWSGLRFSASVSVSVFLFSANCHSLLWHKQGYPSLELGGFWQEDWQKTVWNLRDSVSDSQDRDSSWSSLCQVSSSIGLGRKRCESNYPRRDWFLKRELWVWGGRD